MFAWLRRKPEVKAEVTKPEKPKYRTPWAAVLAAARKPVVASNPFVLPKYPPSAMPDQMLAMDQDVGLGGNLLWAQAAFAGAIREGMVFLGYADLSELAQRAEYRRISETIARHMTRKWIKIQVGADKQKSSKIDKIEKRMNELNVKEHFKKIAEQDGYFGRAHLYIDTGATDNRDELMNDLGDGKNNVSQNKVGKGDLVAFRPIEAIWCYPTDYDSNDPLKPNWYNPQYWFVMGKQLHVSRLLTFVGREVPDLLKPAYSFGGLPMSQMVKPYVDNWLQTRQAVNHLITAFTTWVFKGRVKEALNVDGGEELFRRAELFNTLATNRGMFMVDKDDEEFENVSAPLGGLDKLQAQAQEHMAAVSGIPLVELLGIQPAGLNATSEGEIRVFYEWIHANQESFFRPNLEKVLAFVQLDLFGEVDPDIVFEFEPLWSLDDKEMSEKQNLDAQTDAVLVEAGILSAEEVRKRIADDPETPYQGIDVEDVPLPDPMEMMTGAGAGGKFGAPGGKGPTLKKASAASPRSGTKAGPSKTG